MPCAAPLNILTIIIIIKLFISESDSDRVIIKTKWGEVEGQTTGMGREVHQFLGIPYAEPPIGELRFMKPKPFETSWKEKRYAGEFPRQCMQPYNFQDSKEDCLYLNIWKPATVTLSPESYPVLVWLHGGGYTAGNGNIDASIPASYGLIIVQVNYRLGPYGFLYGGRENLEGNLGLWDQELALQWIKENIVAFSGNPNYITLAGHDSGAACVGLHILSPIGRGYFKRAIMQSGSPFHHTAVQSKNEAEEKFNKFVTAVNCSHIDIKDKTKEKTKELIQCLQSVNTDVINRFTYNAYTSCGNDSYCSPFTPIYGDEYIPYDPETAFKKNSIPNDVHILMGMTDEEGSPFVSGFFPKTFDPIIPKNTFTKDDAKKFIKHLVASVGVESAINSIADDYIKSAKSDDSASYRKTVIDSFGDYYITCPTVLFGYEYAISPVTAEKGRVFSYMITHRPRTSPCTGSTWLGTCHGDDIPFVFGTPMRKPRYFSESDIHFGFTINLIWTSFVKKGEPPSVGPTEWIAVSKSKERDVNFNCMQLHPYNHGKMEKYAYPKCYTLWKNYIHTVEGRLQLNSLTPNVKGRSVNDD